MLKVFTYQLESYLSLMQVAEKKVCLNDKYVTNIYLASD